MGWLPAAFFIGGAVGGFREKTAAAVGWWSGGLLVLGLLAAGLTACPLAVLPSIVPLVTLLGSHHLVSTIRERVGEDPVVVGGKGALFAIAPQSVRGFALLGLTLAALCPTLSRVAERPWSARRSTRSADMREIRKHVPNPGSVVISDVPWQVAWRTGRTALWLPPATQEEPGERPLSSEVAAIHLSPQVLRYGAGEKVMPWQRMFLGRSRPEGFARPIRLPEGGRLFLREGSAMQPGG